MYELNFENKMNIFDDDIRKMIGDFSILWNLYEKYIIKEAEENYRLTHNKRRKQDKIFQENIHEDIIEKQLGLHFLVFNELEIHNCFSRLISFLRLFDSRLDAFTIINFFRVNENENARKEVKDLFEKPIEKWHVQEEFHLLLIVIYRVRNNLFHGMKDVVKLKDEKELFCVCNSILLIILNKYEDVFDGLN